MSEEKKAEIQSLLLALVHALTPEVEIPEAMADQEWRRFILSQITDYTDPGEKIREKAEILFQWGKNGMPAAEKVNLKAVK